MGDGYDTESYMYIYIHIYIRVYIHMYIYMYILYVYLIYLYLYLYLSICIYLSIYLWMGESESIKLWPGAPTAFFLVGAGSQWFQRVYCILIVCRFIMVQPYSTISFLDETNIGADETFIFTSRLGQSKTFPETRKPFLCRSNSEITVLVDC